jgi:hypothetical protein
MKVCQAIYNTHLKLMVIVATRPIDEGSESGEMGISNLLRGKWGDATRLKLDGLTIQDMQEFLADTLR